MGQIPPSAPPAKTTETLRPWSPFYWFQKIIKATAREERRRILETEVPDHLKKLVEYTVRDYYAKRRLKPTAKRSTHPS